MTDNLLRPTIADRVQVERLSMLELYELQAAVAGMILAHEEAAMSKLQAGIPVEGYRLKPGRKTRKVRSPDVLMNLLQSRGIRYDQLVDVKMIGVPALERLLNDTFDKEAAALIMDSHIEVTEGNPSVEYTG